MIQKLKAKFKEHPTMYYAMSIVASWAGVGSLMNFKTLAVGNGAAAAIIWAIFNSLACIIFGVMVEYIPHIRKIMQTKVMFYFIGILTLFQTWTQMNGIREIFSDTAIGSMGGTIIVYAVCIAFVIMLLREGMIRNVLTDGLSWIIVYGLLIFIVIAAMIYTGGLTNNIEAGLTAPGIKTGVLKGLLLIPGPFTYPYYYSLYAYNESNEDGTKKSNIKLSFIFAGIMFAVYMILAAMLTWVSFSPALNMIKAILIAVIAISSMSTYLYSEYLVFGKKIGLAVDIFTIAFWQILIPLGVMGVWTLMSEIRWIIILAVVIVAIGMKLTERKKVSE